MNNTVNGWAVTAGLLAAPFYLTLIIVLGALEPGYSHLTKLMSILGGVPGARGLIFNVGVTITGMLLIIFAIGLWRLLSAKKTAKIGLGLLVLGGLGLIGAGYFHCNGGCKNILIEPDLAGRLHMIMSLLGGLGAGLSPFFIWLALRGNEKWKCFVVPTLSAAIFANLPGIVFWITLATGYRLYSVEGLIQRLGFVVVLVWIFFFAVRLCRINRQGAHASVL